MVVVTVSWVLMEEIICSGILEHIRKVQKRRPTCCLTNSFSDIKTHLKGKV